MVKRKCHFTKAAIASVLLGACAFLAGCGASSSSTPDIPEQNMEAKSEPKSKPIMTFASLGKNPQGYEEYRHEQTGIVFVKLPGGKFSMGCPETEKGRKQNEGPVHEVLLSPFMIAKREVTQAEWLTVMGENPSGFKGDVLPVESVSWDYCQLFCGETGLKLPTEAQWEYACRAGTTGPFAGNTILTEMGWFRDNSDEKYHPVGEKKPNDFGLYDMRGNVWEWCADVYKETFYSTPEAKRRDPLCTRGSELRVFRGGGWDCPAKWCRSAYRWGWPPDSFSGLGLRPTAPLP